MEEGIVWKKLRDQQLLDKNKQLYEAYDSIVLTNLNVHLDNYIGNILGSINFQLPQDIMLSNQNVSSSNDLTQLQKALLFHIIQVLRLKNILHDLKENSNCENNACTITNPNTVLKNLPKGKLATQWAANRVHRYGEFISELQIKNPETYRIQSIIINQARDHLAFDLFNTLRIVLPQVFSNQGLYNNFKSLLKGFILGSYSETENISKYKNIYSYLRQAYKDTRVNLLLDIISAIGLDLKIAKLFVNFIRDTVDENDHIKINQDHLELSDLALKNKIEISDSFYKNNIVYKKSQTLKTFSEILNDCKTLCDSNGEQVSNLKEKLLIIQALIPYKQSPREPLKGQVKINNHMLFNQENISPIINTIISLSSEFTKNKNRIVSLLDELYMKFEYHKSLINRTLDNDTTENHKNLELAEAFNCHDYLTNEIESLSQTIFEHTKKSFFNSTKLDTIAKHAQQQRRELLQISKARADIILDNNLFPCYQNWNSILLDTYKAPLVPDEKVWNYLVTFTPFSQQRRLPGLIQDQLAYLEEIKNLEALFNRVAYHHSNTIPRVDSKELHRQRIVGTVHLQSYALKLHIAQQRLSLFIAFLQFKSIKTIIDSEVNKTLAKNSDEPSSKVSLSLSHNLEDIITNLYKQAKELEYASPYKKFNFNASFPTQQEYNLLQTQLESMNKIIPNNLIELIEQNLKLLSLYHNSPYPTKLNATKIENREQINIKSLSIFRKVITSVLEFHSHAKSHGIFHSFKKIFSNNRHCTPILNNSEIKNSIKPYQSYSPNCAIKSANRQIEYMMSKNHKPLAKP